MRQVLWLLVVKLACVGLTSALQVAAPAKTLDCVPSMQRDVFNMDAWARQHHDPDQIAVLKSQGKIAEDGKTFTDLAFVHIPKTAGDAITLAFKSLGTPHIHHSHVREPHISAWGRGGDQCWGEQAPPKEFAKGNPALAQRVYGGKPVFCVARDPYDRAIAGACHMVAYQGIGHPAPTLSEVNWFLRGALSEFRFGNYRLGTCFWIPQVDFMEGPYGCKHVLDFRNLERDFNDFVRTHGYNITLPPQDATHKCAPKCPFTKDDLDPDVLWLIKDTYREDFERLGPKFGFEA